MNILIAGNFLFPFGSASASRIRHFVVGLTELGAKVHVISQNALYERPEDLCDDSKLRYMGVIYESAVGTKLRYNEKRREIDKILWIHQFIKAAKEVARRAGEIIESENIDVVIQYTTNYSGLKPFEKIRKDYNITLIRDIVEWPTHRFFHGGILHPFYWDVRLGLFTSMLKSDGVIGISKFLVDFYSIHNVPSICVPAIIDIPKLSSVPSKNEDNMGAFNLTYLGKMVKRDGAFQMVKAVRKLLAKGVAIKFNIVGCSGIGGEALKVKEFCKRDKLLRDNVIFRGRVSDSEVKSYLSKADGLIFIRADNIMAKAAFPTRLPEYLVSGKPVVAAGVGDIPAYLRDGVDAVIIFPVTIDKIAQGIERLVQMPDKGASIGISGFHQAERFFDYRTRTRQILEFAKSLQKK